MKRRNVKNQNNNSKNNDVRVNEAGVGYAYMPEEGSRRESLVRCGRHRLKTGATVELQVASF